MLMYEVLQTPVYRVPLATFMPHSHSSAAAMDLGTHRFGLLCR